MTTEIMLLENPGIGYDEYDALDDLFDDELSDDDEDDGTEELLLVEAEPWLSNPKPKRRGHRAPTGPSLVSLVALAGGIYTLGLLLTWRDTQRWRWDWWKSGSLGKRVWHKQLAAAPRPGWGTGAQGSAGHHLKQTDSPTPDQQRAKASRNSLDYIPLAERSNQRDFRASLSINTD